MTEPIPPPQIPWDSIVTLVAVGIGWLLSQLTDLIKKRQRGTTIKKALVNELSIIRKTFSEALLNKNRIPDEQYPFITTTYDSVRIELASFLEPDSLAKVQRTYEEINKVNSESGDVPCDSSDHLFFEIGFKKLIKLIDEAIALLK